MSTVPPVGFGNPPFSDLPPEIQLQISEQCNSQACQMAKFRLQEIRDEFELKCADVQNAYQSWQELSRLTNVFIALLLALMALLIILIALSWVPGVQAALVVVSILFAFVLAITITLQIFTMNAQRRYFDRQFELDEIRERFRLQRSEVAAACNSYCWGDLDEPMCDEAG